MNYYHVDVFSQQPFAGNGLTVLFPTKTLSEEEMQKIACEMKQFETIFLWRDESSEDQNQFIARIFTVEEELEFAGHPVLGAAAVIHDVFYAADEEKEFHLKLRDKTVTTLSKRTENHYKVTMNQGTPEWIREDISEGWKKQYCEALHLETDQLSEQYPMEVVSTGLPYLLIPISRGIDTVEITVENFEALLEQNGAKFVYVFDLEHMEGRTWDNHGDVEDVATGSAAGPMGAYLYQHGISNPEQNIEIHQGRFVGRPSILQVSKEAGTICVTGDVAIVASGNFVSI